MSTTILVPLDGSELAEAALGYAEALSKALGCGVLLFCVVPGEGHEPLFIEGTPPVEASREVWEAREFELGEGDRKTHQEALGALDAMAEAEIRLHAAGVRAHRQIWVGAAADGIVRRAAEDDVVMLVMASHGRTGLHRLLEGSVAAGVLAHTHRPTLVVRPFREGADRTELKHADRLTPVQAEAVRQAIAAAASPLVDASGARGGVQAER